MAAQVFVMAVVGPLLWLLSDFRSLKPRNNGLEWSETVKMNQKKGNHSGSEPHECGHLFKMLRLNYFEFIRSSCIRCFLSAKFSSFS
jgi:hypothetical protein